MTKIEMRDDGYWWPVGAKQIGNKYRRHVDDMKVAMKYVKQPRVAVQAGSYIGGWAGWLAKRFTVVYTFEPFAPYMPCIVKNAPQPNVFMCRGVLSDVPGPVGLVTHSLVSGAHYVLEQDTGVFPHVPAYLLDNLELPHLDLLVLDVEGFELPALKGATESIVKHQPVIMLEDLKLGVKKGRGDTFEDVSRYLESCGYKEVERIAHDVVFIPKDLK